MDKLIVISIHQEFIFVIISNQLFALKKKTFALCATYSEYNKGLLSITMFAGTLPLPPPITSF